MALAAFGACDGRSPTAPSARDPRSATRDTAALPGDTSHLPGDTTSVPGDTTTLPGDSIPVPRDTTGVPGDTTSVPGDTTQVPGDTTSVPGDTTQVPGDTVHGYSHLVVHVLATVGDSATVPVAGVRVTVTAGGSGHVVAETTSMSSGAPALVLRPGRYEVRLGALPPGVDLAPGEPSEQSVVLKPDETTDITFHLRH